MNNFFISVKTEDNKFFGEIYNKNNNTLFYKTQKHTSQQDALDEANMYLRNQTVLTKQTSTSSTPTRRCCGR
jgi:hypothetical protein